jgi:hypothetical protein
MSQRLHLERTAAPIDNNGCQGSSLLQSAALWYILGRMRDDEKGLRQSVRLSPRVARRVKALAKAQKASASRMMAELIESGLEARERERERFMDLADRLTRSTDPADQKRLKEELARLTFGD